MLLKTDPAWLSENVKGRMVVTTQQALIGCMNLHKAFNRHTIVYDQQKVSLLVCLVIERMCSMIDDVSCMICISRVSLVFG